MSKLEKTEDSIIIYAEDEFKRRQVFDILINKLTKRSVDLRFLDRGDPEKIGGDKIKEEMNKVVIFVSHDEKFLDSVADKFWLFDSENTKVHVSDKKYVDLDLY